MSYSLSVSGHKENATAEDWEKVERAANALAAEIVDAGFSAQGSLSHNAGSITIDQHPSTPADAPTPAEHAGGDAV
jgi:hypothetical protein